MSSFSERLRQQQEEVRQAEERRKLEEAKRAAIIVADRDFPATSERFASHVHTAIDSKKLLEVFAKEVLGESSTVGTIRGTVAGRSHYEDHGDDSTLVTPVAVASAFYIETPPTKGSSGYTEGFVYIALLGEPKEHFRGIYVGGQSTNLGNYSRTVLLEEEIQYRRSPVVAFPYLKSGEAKTPQVIQQLEQYKDTKFVSGVKSTIEAALLAVATKIPRVR